MKIKTHQTKCVWLATLLMSVSPFACADAGLPLIVVLTPISILAFIPIILIENLVVCTMLKTGWSTSMKWVFWANVISSIAGIPLTWFFLAIIEFSISNWWSHSVGSGSNPLFSNNSILQVVLTAPWIAPTSQKWALPLAIIVLLPPFFLVSYLVESLYAADMLSPGNIQKGQRAMWWANIASYTFLLVICILWMIWAD